MRRILCGGNRTHWETEGRDRTLDYTAYLGTSTDPIGLCWVSSTQARDLLRYFRRGHVVCGVPIWNSRGRLDVQLVPAYFGLSAVVLATDLCSRTGRYIGTDEHNWCLEHRTLVTLLVRHPDGFFLPEGERETASLRDLLRIHSDHTGEGSADLSVDPCELPDVPLSQLAVAGFIRFWVRGIFARVLA